MSRVVNAAIVLAFAASASSCAGAGEGTISGTAHVAICEMNGAYNMEPSFYGANHEGSTMWIRIQHGGGQAEYTDGLWVTIDDTNAVATAIQASSMRDAQGHPIATFPVGMRGDPGVIIHATLTLDWTCERHKVTRLGSNVGLWAYQGTMTFSAIDNPQPGVDSTNERLTDVTAFQMRMHDPRPVGPNAPHNVPADAPVGDADISGSFSFHYSRQIPAQFFP